MTVHLPADTSSTRFSLIQRVQLATLPRLLAGALELLFRSCSLEVRGFEHFNDALSHCGRCHMAIWHETMILASCHNRGKDYVGMASMSYDGEFGARVLKQWGIHCARGSSSKGGANALSVMVEASNNSTVTGLTVDGPRGPRRISKPGTAILAARTGLPILPCAFAANPAWRLNSWDRTIIPKPFCRLICAYAPAIPPPQSDSPESVENTRIAVEKSLNDLHESIERDS